MPSRTIRKLIQKDQKKNLDDLSTEAQVLFGFLTLIVDIKYRNKYPVSFDGQHSRGYSEEVQFNEVLADQVIPVDDGLLGNSRRELLGL